ncbi:low molecular weight protein-tyrosine-phosphatase [uncultured Kriegella sp.]|uniref:low molecular weight protein-tyrosine-phosphatase n=1 Tax=uncultured Kriegella sp. TaxID=1798910 RepID=UPI0030D7F243|tara:strand:+ start:391518 stop:391967 length:450 start_codon:yes stop_codon:yes gene_type:complete
MATKILMVCLGNICRSPLAEGILQSLVDPTKIIVDSAGTGGYHIGEKPDYRSIAIAKEHGIDISKQRCRKFHVADFREFDVIYAMDKSNYANIIAKAENANDVKKVRLLLTEIDGRENQVPDPYYGGADGFENVFNMIKMACIEIAKKL